MKINEITIRGFKSVENQTVSLKQVNVLIGGNGIGKTNFISAFELLRDIYDQRLQQYVIKHGGANALLYFGKKVTDEICADLEIENDGNLNRYVVHLKESQDRLYVAKSYTSYFSGGKWHDQQCDANTLEATIQKDHSGQACFVAPLLGMFEVYHFHDTGATSPMKGLKAVNDNRKLRRDGSNIAPFLYFLKQKFPKYYGMIEGLVASVTPSFKSFYLEPNRLQPEMIRLEWLHAEGGDQLFNDWQLSDGTLRFICLATLLLQPEPPCTIFIDEPELGLHPQAINKLAALIKNVSEKSQVVVSTQSANLVDHFEPKDVVVVDYSSGASEYRRLQRKDLEQWMNEYSLGEMWEMNVFGGQPL